MHKSFQSSRVPSPVVHAREQDREEDLHGAQAAGGHLRDRRQGPLRQAGQGAAHIRGALLPGQGEFIEFYEKKPISFMYFLREEENIR